MGTLHQVKDAKHFPSCSDLAAQQQVHFGGSVCASVSHHNDHTMPPPAPTPQQHHHHRDHHHLDLLETSLTKPHAAPLVINKIPNGRVSFYQSYHQNTHWHSENCYFRLDDSLEISNKGLFRGGRGLGVVGGMGWQLNHLLSICSL